MASTGEDVGGGGGWTWEALLFRFRESGWLRVQCYDCMKLEAKLEQNNLNCPQRWVTLNCFFFFFQLLYEQVANSRSPFRVLGLVRKFNFTVFLCDSSNTSIAYGYSNSPFSN